MNNNIYSSNYYYYCITNDTLFDQNELYTHISDGDSTYEDVNSSDDEGSNNLGSQGDSKHYERGDDMGIFNSNIIIVLNDIVLLSARIYFFNMVTTIIAYFINEKGGYNNKISHNIHSSH